MGNPPPPLVHLVVVDLNIPTHELLEPLEHLLLSKIITDSQLKDIKRENKIIARVLILQVAHAKYKKRVVDHLVSKYPPLSLLHHHRLFPISLRTLRSERFVIKPYYRLLKKRRLHVASINVNRATRYNLKIALSHWIECMKPHVTMIQETWTNDLFVINHQVYTSLIDDVNRGCAIIINQQNNWKTSRIVEDFPHGIFIEATIPRYNGQPVKVVFASVYMPHAIKAQAIDTLTRTLQDLADSGTYQGMFIGGDYNTSKQKLNKIIEKKLDNHFTINQLQDPTRITTTGSSQTCIDHVIYRGFREYHSKIDNEWTHSDHKPVQITFNITPTPIPTPSPRMDRRKAISMSTEFISSEAWKDIDFTTDADFGISLSKTTTSLMKEHGGFTEVNHDKHKYWFPRRTRRLFNHIRGIFYAFHDYKDIDTDNKKKHNNIHDSHNRNSQNIKKEKEKKKEFKSKEK